MKKTAHAWVSAGIVLLVMGLLAQRLPGWLHLSATRAIILRVGLLVLGFVAAALLYLYLAARAKARAKVPAVDSGDTTDQTMAAAQAHLARSGAGDARIGRLPLALVLGAAGSTKTSIIAHSGLDAELLAGEVYRGETTVPTDPVNVWYAQRTIFLEAGGRLLEDASRWSRFTRHLQPRRLAAAFGRGAQAPRLAIVCFACDEFLKPGAGESVTAAARKLRARLADISQQLGIRLPVYVLFTRADRLPYFTDYVRSMAQAEAQQVLGATLPVTFDTSGAWAERESQRLNQAFGRIVQALSLRRLDVLSRETGDDVRAGAYEFPRELRKISELAVQFLIDVARPNQLGVNPLLRGFYFTGVRPVIKTDSALDAPRPPAGPAPMTSGATSVFDARLLQQAMAAAPARGATRKVPEWVFLHRLFREVILADDVAFKLTSGGTRVDLLRRGLIGAAAAACVLLSLGFTVSWASNARLINRAQRSLAAVGAVGGVPGALGLADLAQLDSLREINAQLREHKEDGRPLRYRFGLYRGEGVHAKVRAMYFERFRLAMWNDTRARLMTYLGGLPDQPADTSDFSKAQDALAAHLVTTSEFRRSSAEQLVPVLMSYWGRTAEQDSARAIGQRQFEFFATELPFGNPYNDAPDDKLVRHSRQFLLAFGPQAYYRALLSSASAKTQSVRYIGPPAVIRNEVVVPGAFTRAGYTRMLTDLDSIDVIFERYQWIYGSQPPSKATKTDLEKLYFDDYVRTWQNYLAGASVQGFSSPGEAAATLQQLAGSSSPLFSMLNVAAKETRLDDTLSAINRAFQPLHATVPPNDPRGVIANVQSYTQSLGALAVPVAALQNMGAGAEPVMLQASTAANAVRQEIGTLSGNFITLDAAGATAAQIQRLLRQPADFAENIVSGAPAAALNAAAADFCSKYAPLAGRLPFSPRGKNADVPAVLAFFKKDDGQLWSFYQDNLQTRLTPSGEPRAGQKVRDDFRAFFARSVDFTNAMIHDGALSLVVDFQPDFSAGMSEIVLQVDGDRKVYTPNNPSSRFVTYEPERSADAKITVTLNREVITVASGTGPWSVFQLFHAAQWSGASPFRVEWRNQARNVGVVGRVSFEAGVPPVLRPGYLAALAQCPSRVVN